MRKTAEGIISVLRGVFFVGFTVQGILGLMWMAGNFTKRQSLKTDSGLLYPLILKIAEGMGKIFHIPYFCIVYVLQIAAAAWAVWLFLKVFQIFEERFWLRIWSVTVILTNFMTTQCLLALLPNAFLASGVLIFCALTFRIKKQGNSADTGKNIILLCFVWIVLTGLSGEYLVFALLLLPASFLILYGKKMLWTVFAGLTVTAVLGLGFGMEFWEASFSRFTWNTFFYGGQEVPGFVRDVLSEEELFSLQLYADVIPAETIPAIESRLGEKEARKFFRDSIKYAWMNSKTVILHDIAWDLLGYTVSPIIVGLQLKGEGFRSLSTRNYELMERENPVLTRFYVNYEICWARALLAAGLLWMVLCFAVTGMNGGREAVFFCGLSGAVEAVWYTFQGAGIMDYKQTIVAVMFWEILCCALIDRERGTDKEREKS